MLKRPITYDDFEGNSVTDTFYFNISRTELLELEVEYEMGFRAAIERIIEANDRKKLIAEFQRIILLAYGEKSEDGKRFIKSDTLRNEFTQTNAYDALFMDLSSNEDSAVAFLSGILPKEVRPDQDKPTLAPVPPSINQ